MKRRAWLQPCCRACEKNIFRKGPLNCRSLGCARDDKGKGGTSTESGCRSSSQCFGPDPGATTRVGPRIKRLRGFSICVRTPEFGKPEGRTADPSATLGMTILFGNAKYSFQDELSSRPERSGAEGSAVRPSGFPNSGALTQRLKPSSLLGLYGPTKVGP